ncbi:hypothetical protein [Faecalimonas sp.]
MKQRKYLKTASAILYVALTLCLIFSTLSGLSLLPITVINTDSIPLFILSAFYIIWFICIVVSFLLPIIKRVLEEKGKETTNILFGSGTLLVFTLFSLFMIFFSTISYLFYMGLRTGHFHSR